METLGPNRRNHDLWRFVRARFFDFVVQNGPAFREYFAIALQNDLNQVIDAVQSARSRLSEETSGDIRR